MNLRDLTRLPLGRYMLSSKHCMYTLNKALVPGITSIGKDEATVYHIMVLGISGDTFTLHLYWDEDENTGFKYPRFVGLCHAGDISLHVPDMRRELDKLSFRPRSSYMEWTHKVSTL